MRVLWAAGRGVALAIRGPLARGVHAEFVANLNQILVESCHTRR